MRLKSFIWIVIGGAIFILLLQIFVFPSQRGGSPSSYFAAMLLVIGSGLELVRQELAELRRAINR